MLKVLGAGIAIALAGYGTAGAAPLSPAPLAGDASSIVLVRGGCGLGFHRGPYGGCRPNRGPFFPGPRVVAPLPPPPPCPPGYARDPRPAVRLCYPL